MTKAQEAYRDLLLEFYALVDDDKEDSQEADQLRFALDRAWDDLTPEEQDKIGTFTAEF